MHLKGSVKKKKTAGAQIEHFHYFLQVFTIELVIFAVDFVPLALEFGIFVVEFIGLCGFTVL